MIYDISCIPQALWPKCATIPSINAAFSDFNSDQYQCYTGHSVISHSGQLKNQNLTHIVTARCNLKFTTNCKLWNDRKNTINHKKDRSPFDKDAPAATLELSMPLALLSLWLIFDCHHHHHYGIIIIMASSSFCHHHHLWHHHHYQVDFAYHHQWFIVNMVPAIIFTYNISVYQIDGGWVWQ